jgi:hypothetical protein
MAAPKNINTEDDFLKVGPDATATFDNSLSNPTEHASSENLRVPSIEDDLEEDEDEEEDLDDDEDDVDEEEEENEEYDDEIDDDREDEDDEEEEDHDLARGPKAPSAYKRL